MSSAKQQDRREWWRQRIAQYKASGQTVRAFCRQHQLDEHSFYMWRKQLENAGAVDKPVGFALVETTRSQAPAQMLELVLRGGERLYIPAEEATLRLVLRALGQQA
jgi:transposase-like protein